MSNAHQIMEVSEPTDIALREAIRSFTDEDEEKSNEAMMADYLAILGRACARLADGATTQEAIADLAFHGLDHDSAESIVQKAGETVAANGRMHDAARAAQPANNGLMYFGVAVIVLLAVLAYLTTAG